MGSRGDVATFAPVPGLQLLAAASNVSGETVGGAAGGIAEAIALGEESGESGDDDAEATALDPYGAVAAALECAGFVVRSQAARATAATNEIRCWPLVGTPGF